MDSGLSADIVTGLFEYRTPGPGRLRPDGSDIGVVAVNIRNHETDPVLVTGCELAFRPDGGCLPVPDRLLYAGPDLPCGIAPGQMVSLPVTFMQVKLFLSAYRAVGTHVEFIEAVVVLADGRCVMSPSLAIPGIVDHRAEGASGYW